jgi:hypothetical protein
MKFTQIFHTSLLVFFGQLHLLLFQQTPNLLLTDVKSSKNFGFYEEPSDTYITQNAQAILKCKIENARKIFFKCNEKWSLEEEEEVEKEGLRRRVEEDASTKTKLVQIGNKQILTTEMSISSAQMEEYTKTILTKDSDLIPEFWCTCQGWQNNADDMIISRKAFIKLACM